MDLDELTLLRRARDRMDRDHALPLDVPALARGAFMSTAHFSRQFRAAYGETPYSYLMTRRIERAKALLTVQNEVENEGFRWITVATADQPEIQIVLSQPRAGRSDQDGEAIATLLAKGELGTINFVTDDLDATFDKAAGAPGAEVVQEPADQFWGVRDAAVRDPAGNLVRIEQG